MGRDMNSGLVVELKGETRMEQKLYRVYRVHAICLHAFKPVSRIWIKELSPDFLQGNYMVNYFTTQDPDPH